jgi:hypothetical protein
MSDYLAQQAEYADDAPAQRTKQEIADLKANWLNDSCWDIEETEGFEAHYQELRQWRAAEEAAWSAENARRLAARGDLLGFTPKQMEFLERLEGQIKLLQSELDRHLNH